MCKTDHPSIPATVPSTDLSNARSFIGLPAELRNYIYRLLLVKGSPIYPRKSDHRTEERSVVALLQTNKQIRDEALSIYFGLNDFRFEAEDGGKMQLNDFAMRIGSQARAHAKPFAVRTKCLPGQQLVYWTPRALEMHVAEEQARWQNDNPVVNSEQ